MAIFCICMWPPEWLWFVACRGMRSSCGCWAVRPGDGGIRQRSMRRRVWPVQDRQGPTRWPKASAPISFCVVSQSALGHRRSGKGAPRRHGGRLLAARGRDQTASGRDRPTPRVTVAAPGHQDWFASQVLPGGLRPVARVRLFGRALEAVKKDHVFSDGQANGDLDHILIWIVGRQA
jgi:hypothetical protein